MPRAVGIDLGTTNSVVAVLEGGEPLVIPNAEGSRTSPSVVGFSKTGEILVGEVAKRQAITNPDRTVRSIKRQMGHKDWSIDIDGKKWTPQEISSQILLKLKRDAEAYLGDKVTQAVVTVPAYFNDAQRQATKEAGQIAGLEVLRIINEPTAASLAYGLDKQTDQTILVFDLGGGTFDVSLLEIGDGVFEVKATSSDTHLGGDDWDQRIIDHLLKEVRNNHGVDLSKDRMAHQLTGVKESHKGVNQDELVAVGAALQAAVMKGEVKDVLLLDVTPLSMGIETKGGIFTKLIDRNTTIPTRKSEVFSTAEDNQSSVEIHVLQGERPMARDNRTLGKFHLVGIPPAPRGIPQIEVTFDIDANGIVNVSAKDLGTGKEQKITITSSSGLSKDDINKMVREADSHAEEDKRKREEIEARNRADSLVYSTEKVLHENRDKLSDSDAKSVEAAIADCKKALEGTDIDAINRAADALTQASHKVAEAMYKSGAQAGGGQRGPSGDGSSTTAGGKSDDVIDAEYVDADEKKKEK